MSGRGGIGFDISRCSSRIIFCGEDLAERGGAERLGASCTSRLLSSLRNVESKHHQQRKMRFHTAAAAFAASAYCVQAFKDTSPFLLWSSSPCVPNA